MTGPLHVIVAGGGIGGLATAVALQQRGLRVTVLEQARELRELGVGIQLSPNGVGVLAGWGLDAAVTERGQLTLHAQKHTRDGALLRHRLAGLGGGYAHPQVGISRGRLQLLLRDTACALGDDVLQLHRKLESFASDEDGIVVQARCPEDGSVHRYRGDLLVGADGIHSTVRSTLHPGADPEYTGYVIWRGTVPVASVGKLPFEPGVTDAWGDGQSFFNCYFMNPEHFSFGVCAKVGDDGDVIESWSGRGSPEEIRAHYGACDGPLETFLEHADVLMKMHVHDHATLPTWNADRVTLLGDAAHAMLPFAGQGAVSAIEDAECLAVELENATDAESVRAACDRYEAQRLPVAAKIRDYCRQKGGIFEEFLALEEIAGDGLAGMTREEKEQVIAGIDWSTRESFLRKLY
jgi:2-polyprenyl-6-methoxyphenol hydroxylase-like FAD-dependent oxidoreductase